MKHGGMQKAKQFWRAAATHVWKSFDGSDVDFDKLNRQTAIQQEMLLSTETGEQIPLSVWSWGRRNSFTFTSML
jgi:hypothetical protein